jgi:hypothetical protein
MKSLNEEIGRIKKLIIYELSEKEGDSLLGNETDVVSNPMDTEIEVYSNDKDDPKVVNSNFTYGACDIQNFLIEKGYLTKKDKDCDFGDMTAQALGNYIKNKLGIDLKINSVSDLQSYMKLLGFDTGSPGFGKLMAQKIGELIDYLENLADKLLNDPKVWEVVRKLLNSYTYMIRGTELNPDKKDQTYEEVKDWAPDIYVNYPMKFDSVNIDKITKNAINLSGTLDLKVLLKYGYYDTLDYTKVNFAIYMWWAFVEKVIDKKNCLCLKLKPWDVVLNSSGVGFDKTYWTLSIDDNTINIDFGTVFGYDIGDIDLDKIDALSLVKDQKLTFCVKYEDMIKTLVGEKEVKNINVIKVK